jgi:hypothetical protein
MTVFELCNLVVLPFWLLMVLLPAWTVTRRLIASPWVVAPPAVLYLVTLLPVATMILPEVVNPVQARIMGRARGYSAWWVSPVLVLTLLVGPVGFLIYLAARTIVGGAPVAAEPA